MIEENNFDLLKKKIIKILKKNKIKRAGIFGSYARGDAKKDSDVDILIEIKSKKFSLMDLVGLQIQLEDVLKKKVDLLTYKSLNYLLKENILNEEIRII
jgi:hypothetical protein